MGRSEFLGMRSIVFVVSIALILIGAPIIPSAVEAKEIQVFINNISFSPQAIHAAVGDRITWINNDGVLHEIYFSGNPTNSGDPRLRYQLRFSQRVSVIVTKPGDYDYVCRWHGMSGSIHIDKKTNDTGGLHP
jgi:plastocyanin